MKITNLICIVAYFFSRNTSASGNNIGDKNCIRIEKEGYSTIKANINDVIDGTEAGFIETNCGIYYLPSSETEVKMEFEDFEQLKTELRSCINKKSTLLLSGKILSNDGTAVVGVSCNEDKKVTPKYSFRKIKEDVGGFSKKKGVMKRWDEDTYRISLQMDSVVYCIMREYENFYRYNSIKDALSKISKRREQTNKNISIYYYSSGGNEECEGGFLRSVESESDPPPK